MNIPKIAIIGEFHSSVTQIAINNSLDWLKKDLDFHYQWIDTLSVNKEKKSLLQNFTGIWSASGSPFNSLNGALEAIKYARTNNIPHLGTCGGFQHTIIEFARNVLGVKDAQHEEYDRSALTLFITKLSCSSAGKAMSVKIKRHTLAFACYNDEVTVEDFYCNYGINPVFKDRLNHSGLVFSGTDNDDEIRIIEIPENDFFLATLFVPQTRGTKEKPHPVIKAFVEKCMDR